MTNDPRPDHPLIHAVAALKTTIPQCDMGAAYERKAGRNRGIDDALALIRQHQATPSGDCRGSVDEELRAAIEDVIVSGGRDGASVEDMMDCIRPYLTPKPVETQLRAKNGECHYCGGQTNNLAGNPGLWPVVLPQNGVPTFHHAKCVKTRLDAVEAQGADLTNWYLDRALNAHIDKGWESTGYHFTDMKRGFIAGWEAAKYARTAAPAMGKEAEQADIARIIIKHQTISPRKHSDGALVNGQLNAATEIMEYLSRQPLSPNAEMVAKEIYKAMQWAVRHAENGRHTPDWQENGNSTAQDIARKAAKSALQEPKP